MSKHETQKPSKIVATFVCKGCKSQTSRTLRFDSIHVKNNVVTIKTYCPHCIAVNYLEFEGATDDEE